MTRAGVFVVFSHKHEIFPPGGNVLTRYDQGGGPLGRLPYFQLWPRNWLLCSSGWTIDNWTSIFIEEYLWYLQFQFLGVPYAPLLFLKVYMPLVIIVMSSWVSFWLVCLYSFWISSSKFKGIPDHHHITTIITITRSQLSSLYDDNYHQYHHNYHHK